MLPSGLVTVVLGDSLPYPPPCLLGAKMHPGKTIVTSEQPVVRLSTLGLSALGASAVKAAP